MPSLVGSEMCIRDRYPSFTTWDPFSGTTPVSPVAPCTQVGWGVVNMSNIEPMLMHLNGTQPMDNRPGDVVLCMNINQEAREAYWGVYPSAPDEALLIDREAIFKEE